MFRLLKSLFGLSDESTEIEKSAKDIEEKFCSRSKKITPQELKVEIDNAVDIEQIELVLDKYYKELKEQPKLLYGALCIKYYGFLDKVQSIEDLDKFYEKCDAFFVPLYIPLYRKLIQREPSLEVVRSYVCDCDEAFLGVMGGRYKELLDASSEKDVRMEKEEVSDEYCLGLVNNRLIELSWSNSGPKEDDFKELVEAWLEKVQ